MNPAQILICLFFVSVLFSCNQQTTEYNYIEVSGVAKPEILLNGTWKFTMTPPEDFWKNGVDFQDWPDIQVPGECQMQGFAIKHDQPYAYKTEFVVPEDYRGKQIQLNFYGVYSDARVWVNGHFVREHSGGFTKWTCNITEYVEAGEEAILTLEITDRTDDISYGSGYAKHQIGGILRDVELTALPKQNFNQLFFETNLDENYQNAELNVYYELTKSSSVKIKIELYNANNELITVSQTDASSISGQISIPVDKPEQWDAEHPNLYTVITSLLENGKETFITSKKIGFREIVVDENKLLVNGSPVKLRGACRHDIHPTLGRLTTPEYDLKDVQLAKECNMNFIRTSHYPPSETFLDYCDEYGIYVEDETAVCFVGAQRSGAYHAVGASQSDSAFKDKYLSQLEEMVQNHRNHPSVIIYSIGNENDFGNNFVEEYKWVKQNDLTRPVIYSYPGRVPDSVEIYDIVSMHYPNWQGNLSQDGIETTGFESIQKPMLFDEWAHVACYNSFELKEDPNVRNFWGQSLDSMWTYVFETEGGLGGAIWCMLDETFMLPKDLEPTVGYGEWGIVDTWRRKKPEFWGTKKAYSPTKIYTKQIYDFQADNKLKIPVHNRFDHTNFSELKIVWKYGEQSGDLANVDLGPHQKGELVFPANNWNSEEMLNIQFLQNDTFLIDEYNLQIGNRAIELPICESGKMKVEEGENKIVISGKDFSVDVNKTTGLLENLRVKDELILQSGPHINLKIPGETIGGSTEMEDYAQNWKLKDLCYEVRNGIVYLQVKGKYDKVSAAFNIKIDENGVFNFDYKLDEVRTDKNIQEAGMKFITGNNFKKLAWDRNAYFSAYPEYHMGAPSGEVLLNDKPDMIYRTRPQHNWEMDTKNFYYFGLEPELTYTNIVRGSKENIYYYSLKTTDSEITLFSDGSISCRFDKIKDENTLIVNEIQDYNGLLWGNYSKRIKSEGIIEGEVTFLCKEY